MGGCRCSYKNCTNSTTTRDNLHFFRYPVKQKDRCRQWIENAEKPQFYQLTEDQLRNRAICETHFKECYFLNIQKKRLLEGAIPTLEGDCQKVLPLINQQNENVNISSTNEKGTVLLLETNMGTNFWSEKVEHYICTNNGFLVPVEENNDNVQTLYEEPSKEPQVKHMDTTNLTNFYENFMTKKDVDNNYILVTDNINKEKNNSNQSHVEFLTKAVQTQSEQQNCGEKMIQVEDEISKTLTKKYVNKIKQHSKDIAILKRMLKSKTICRKPSNDAILNSLKRQVSSSLFSVVNLNMNPKAETSVEDLEFYSTIFSKSPELYQILINKYQWKLPSPSTFHNANQQNKQNK